MFTILGSDGREYGPASAGQLRQWILEGRAGGATQVRREGESSWVPLQQIPEVADVFQAPPVSTSAGAVTPIVTTLAWAMFVVTGISALLLLSNLVSILLIPVSTSFSGNVFFYLHWGVALASLPARIVVGIGLLRGRSWARLLAIALAVAWTLYGGWGLTKMIAAWCSQPNLIPGILRSPMYLISCLWSVAMFLFNIATLVILSRRDVREAMATR